MNFFDSVKNTVGGAVKTASKDENVKAQVKDTMAGTVEKIARDKVDSKIIKDTVNTVVDESAKFAQNKLGEKKSSGQ